MLLHRRLWCAIGLGHPFRVRAKGGNEQWLFRSWPMEVRPWQMEDCGVGRRYPLSIR